MNYFILHLKGGYAMISECDFDLISKYHWVIDSNGYVITRPYNKETKKCGVIFMHRLILGLTDGSVFTDHKNHHKSDNRRENIRPASPLQNNRNRKPKGACKYLGVTYQTCRFFSKKTGEPMTYKYIKAKINYGGKLLHVGTFTNEIDAARAYDVAAKRYFGEFANLNNV